MARRKVAGSAATESELQEVEVPISSQSIAKSPSTLRFLILVFSSYALSFAAHTVASFFAEGDLAGVSRTTDDWARILGFLGGRAVELGLGWWGQYDCVDMASLTLLSHMPYFQLLRIFYDVRPTTILTNLLVDVMSVFIPLYFLRPISVTHAAHAPKSAVSNRSVINDFGIQCCTTALAAGLYGLVLYLSLVSWLPVYIVTHFDGVRSLQAAHEAGFVFVAVGALPLGLTAKVFIFTPAMGSRPDTSDARNAAFNPETATFWETFVFNIWGYSKRTRTLIQRTATLIAFTSLHTWFQTYFVVEGAEFFGAAGWSAVWALAATVTGIVFWWVGDVEGVSN